MLTKKDMKQLFKIMPDLKHITVGNAVFEYVEPDVWYLRLLKQHLSTADVIKLINAFVNEFKDKDIIWVVASNGKESFDTIVQDRVVINQIEDARKSRKSLKGRNTHPKWRDWCNWRISFE